ncbi:MAG: signal recognition particle-docking protein FtsY [Proteobacteria bacterium]|jgi:fused signal recognition particle receptor|nr:signal recognition particle-docking protein FtsY [Pseudomonadota bacterium]MBT6193395.1 signal recognition particle-docking protein FtsY [Pseudomonadota bacterium]MBT6464828.1 signal recognition particle-docking protein FtsY [Pseudomonadota bacterium]MBT7246643.1 signal recognition particle-docking protein FtsY [Pseudomonadota bacterium]MBT7561729.1 signal recognition particle-docking protein FtsY [Pseudomonadota bacterium]
MFKFLTTRLSDAFKLNKKLDVALLEEAENLLLASDVGFSATEKIIRRIKNTQSKDQAIKAMRIEMIRILEAAEGSLNPRAEEEKTKVVLLVGVNGAGKTTTISKLALQMKNKGLATMLAAGDTFRAAASEQLESWGESIGVQVIAAKNGGDPSSLAYEAHNRALREKADILLVDTAGRLHTQSDLMAELAKIKRVLAKQDVSAPHETLLVLDGTTGQNAISQAQVFIEQIGITGIVITKLDGTAKGGVVFDLVERFKLPIKYIGVGESAESLLEFTAERYVNTLLNGF